MRPICHNQADWPLFFPFSLIHFPVQSIDIAAFEGVFIIYPAHLALIGHGCCIGCLGSSAGVR